jgi:hypothetical protein
MNILEKFQPEFPILMIMGGDLARYGPTTGERVRIG